MRFYELVNFFIEQLLYLLVFLPPLVFLPLWNDEYDISKFFCSSLLTGLIVFLIGVSLLLNKSNKLDKSDRGGIRFDWILFWLYFAVFLIFLISTIFSTHPLTSFFGGEYLYTQTFFHMTSLLLLSLSVYIWLQLREKEEIVSNLAMYISSSALLVSAFGLFQLLQHPNTIFTTYRVRSSIGQPNKLAYYLIATFPISIALIFDRQIYRRILGGISVILTFILIIFTFSRGAWIAMGLSFLIFSFTQRHQIFGYLRKIRLNFISIIFLCLIAFFIPSPIGKRVVERITAVKNDLTTQSGSIYLRFADLHGALKVFSKQSFYKKLIGIGPDTLTFDLLALRDPALNVKRSPDERTWRTFYIPSQHLHTLVNTGILGFLVLVAIIGLTIKQFHNLKKHSSLELGFYGSFLMVVFSGLVYFETSLTSLFFWIMLAFLWSKPIINGWIKLLSFIFIFVGIFIFSYTTLYAFADNFAFRGDYQKATKFLPFFDKYWRDWANLYSGKVYETNSEQDVKIAMDLSKKALSINPLEIKNIASVELAYYTGGIFFDKSYHQKALEMGKKRVLLDPAHADGFDTLGRVFLDIGQLDEALANFQQAITTNPDIHGSYLHIGEVYKQKGDLDRAIEYYQTAIDKFPNSYLAKIELDKAKSLKEGKDKTKTSISYRQNKDLQEDMEESMKLMGEWFVKNQTEKGDFVYEREVETGKTVEGYNIVRQAGSLYGLAQLYKRNKDPQIQKTLERGFQFFQKYAQDQNNLKTPSRWPTSDAGLLEGEGISKAIVYEGEKKSNTSALLLLALIEYMEADEKGGREYLEFARHMANYLMSTQKESGGYIQSYNPEEESDYNNGETFYALVRMYILDKNDQYLKSARKAAKYLIDKYRRQEVNLSFYSWGMAGFSHLYKIDRQDKDWKFIKSYTDKFMERNGRWAEEYFRGRSNEAPRGGLGVFLEGIAHVAWIAEDKDTAYFTRLARFTRESLEYLMTLQIDGPRSDRHSSFDVVKGGICYDQDCKTQRIDIVHHNLSAIYLYLTLVLGK